MPVPHPRHLEAGVPLGGIGAGKIEFCADGRFTNVTTNNNWDCPIIDGKARIPPTPRILEGDEGSVEENIYRRKMMFSSEGVPGAWMAVHTPVDGARVLKTVGRKAFKTVQLHDISYEGRFPCANVHYSGFESIHLTLNAYSPFSMPDTSDGYRDSALPLALFVFDVENQHDKSLPVSLIFSWQNLNGIGGYAGTVLDHPEVAAAPVFRDASDAESPGLWFGHDHLTDADPRVLGDYSLRVWSDAKESDVSYYAGWDPEGEGREIWEPLEKKGMLPNHQDDYSAGALGIRSTVASGGRITVVFALAWHMPHLLAAETKWDHLVRPSSAPPEPESADRRDYGHAYGHWFDDSWTIAEYGIREWKNIKDRIDAWQQALQESSLPTFFVPALCNDLFPLVSNSWYTGDGLYSVNEAPTDMNGCMGTMDQRAAGNAAVACAFPDLDRAELDLFAADQIREHSDLRRYGTHWNTVTGRYERRLDRTGAILHDIGWDHLEGGRLGDALWTCAHWPDLVSVFILQVYQHALWTGDAEWLSARYPNVQAALRFLRRLDQDRDYIPDLWGAGSNTYDTELYPYYGASSFVATLYLAALRAGEQVADYLDDEAFASECKKQFGKAQETIENDLWDENLGYYISWRDENHQVWSGAAAHEMRSPNCHISQLAGAWYADLLGLGDIVDPERRRRALASIGTRNVDQVPGAPANEYTPDGAYSESFTAYAITYYAAQAIAAGLPDPGWEAVNRHYTARYENDNPWDAPLQMSGPGNLHPQWGRWYMSHPASWYVLNALGGVRIDRLRGTLRLMPSWPSNWDDTLEALPVFLPGLRGRVDAKQDTSVWEAGFHIVELAGDPIHIQTIETELPADFDPSTVRIEATGLSPTDLQVASDGHVRIEEALTLAREGDGFTITAVRDG